MTSSERDRPPAADGPSDRFVTSVFDRDCTSRSTMEDVATKWSMLVLVALADADFRFNALRRRVDGVSEKMLAQTLQTLERDGMITRTVLSTTPTRVQYSLTPLGATAAEHLSALIAVLEGTIGEVEAARTAYDERRREGTRNAG